ncbi:MAG: hypothetical protein C4297_06140 [Gemmataceae bacterium]
MDGIQCQSCAKPATIHLTEIEPDGTRKEIHLCQACAEDRHLVSKQELHLPAIVHALLGAHVGRAAEELARLRCPACGIKFMEFRTAGRLGCPLDYDLFRQGLLPLLDKLHRHVAHRGKRPHKRHSLQWQREVLELRTQLRRAVEQEDYERAARLRDQLRAREKHP